MLVVYITFTGKVKNFVERTNYKNILEIKTGLEKTNEPFVLICGTIGFGEINPNLIKFLKNNKENLKAVIGSGNKNWGSVLFCKAAKDISKTFKVPLLFTFENSGNNYDLEKFKEILT